MGHLKGMSCGRTHTFLRTQVTSQFFNEFVLLRPHQQDQKSISGKATARSVAVSTTSLARCRLRTKNASGNLRTKKYRKQKCLKLKLSVTEDCVRFPFLQDRHWKYKAFHSCWLPTELLHHHPQEVEFSWEPSCFFSCCHQLGPCWSKCVFVVCLEGALLLKCHGELETTKTRPNCPEHRAACVQCWNKKVSFTGTP